MIPTNNEKFLIQVFSRKKNSAYNYDDSPTIEFYGRPANNAEKKTYRILKGVHGQQETLYLYVTNLPEDLKPGDMIRFQGTDKIVETIGYYYNNSLIVNPSVMSDEYVIARCPKGITVV